MNISDIARALGSKGGKARAKRLPPAEKRRIDVLFDFPIPARELAGRSVPARTPAGVLHVASIDEITGS